MTHDRQQIEQLAREYTEAWCSRDPTRVAAYYVTGGTIAINGGEPAPITGVAESFVAAFPDIEVFMDDLQGHEGGPSARTTSSASRLRAAPKPATWRAPSGVRATKLKSPSVVMCVASGKRSR